MRPLHCRRQLSDAPGHFLSLVPPAVAHSPGMGAGSCTPAAPRPWEVGRRQGVRH